MKKQFNLLNSLTLLAVGLLVALSSCSKSAAIYDTIPADVAAVVKVNAEPIVKALDIKTENGVLVLPDNLKKSVGTSVNQPQLDLIAKLYTSIDVNNILMIIDGGQVGFTTPSALLTFSITDSSKFNHALIELAGNKESSGGYDIYSAEGTCVLVKGDQAWITDGHAGNAVTTLDALLERADKKPLGKLTEVTDELADDDPVTMMINSAAYAQGATVANWASILTMQFDAKGTKVVGKGHYFTADGKKAKMPNTKNLDTDFLKYIPANAVLVLASGIDGSMDWDKIVKENSAQLDYQSAAILGTVVPFLKSLDGTTSVAVWPLDASAWSNPSLENIGFNLMLGVKKDNRETILGQINMMITQVGIAGQPQGDMTVYALPGFGTIRVGIVDDYVTVTNTPLASADNSLKPIFSGNVSAMYLNIPSLALLGQGRGLPEWGIKGNITCEDDEFELEVEPVGTDMTFLQAILNQLEK